MSKREIESLFEESIELKRDILESGILEVIGNFGDEIVGAIKNGNKLLLCGNGGSAADAQHLAAELVVRLRPKNNREALPALAMALDASTITACGNDFGYDNLYARVLKALGQKGDVLLVISTSGNSENVNRALQVSRSMGILSLGFLGGNGGMAVELCDSAFLVPSFTTGRIQEAHITAGHALMEYIEDKLLEEGYLSIDVNTADQI